MNNTRFLITGGSGFVGSAFIKSLPKGCHVTVLTRDTENAKKTLNGAHCSVTFLNSLATLKSADEFDCIINLAGEPIADKRWSGEQIQRIQSSRWQITTQLVTLIEKSSAPPAVFISGSAIGFYGRQGTTPVTENTHTVNDEFTHKLCATWENIALSAQSTGTRVCLLRTGIVLAKGQGALAKMTLPFQLGLGGPIGSGTQGMSWIHIDDMVAAIQFLIDTPSAVGAFNFTAPQPVSNKTFVKALGSALNRPAVIPMPAFALKILMGESSDLLLTGQFVLPEKLENAGFSFRYQKLEPAFDAIFN